MAKGLKRASKWFNAIADAWAMGEADWAYEGPRLTSTALRVWEEALAAAGDEDAAAGVLEAYARERGIDPRRHRWHGGNLPPPRPVPTVEELLEMCRQRNLALGIPEEEPPRNWNVAEACEVAGDTPVAEWPEKVFAAFWPEQYGSDFTIFGQLLPIQEGASLIDTLVATGLCSSKGDARRDLKQGAVRVKGSVVREECPLTRADAIHACYVVLGIGRSAKKVALLPDP